MAHLIALTLFIVSILYFLAYAIVTIQGVSKQVAEMKGHLNYIEKMINNLYDDDDDESEDEEPVTDPTMPEETIDDQIDSIIASINKPGIIGTEESFKTVHISF